MKNVFELLPDNGGRRALGERRFFVSKITDKDRRANWKRREGIDRRIKRRVK